METAQTPFNFFHPLLLESLAPTKCPTISPCVSSASVPRAWQRNGPLAMRYIRRAAGELMPEPSFPSGGTT